MSREEALAIVASPQAQWRFERKHPNLPTAQTLAQLAGLSLPSDLPCDIVPAQHHPAWIALMDTAKGQTAPPRVEEAPVAPNPVGSWDEYFHSMLDKPVHPLYVQATPFLAPQGKAFDLASGTGQGALHLLKEGQEVWATDIHGEALAVLYRRTPEELRHRLHVRVASFETLSLGPDSFDTLAAGFCLFFMSSQLLAEKWPMMVRALRPGGVFFGQFLGVRDDWAAEGYTAQTREEVVAMLQGFEILQLEEAERDGKTSQGTDKHWHVFHVIARKAL